MTLKRAKVRYRNPYQTRHTYASMMLTAGESEMWVARQMGHTSVATIDPSALPDAGRKAVAMFAENAGKNAGKSREKQAKTG